MSQEGEAWERWVARHGSATLLYARQLTRSAADVEDAVQDRFARFWRHRSKARDSVALLYACVRSAIMDQRRTNERRRRRETVVVREMPMFAMSTIDEVARREVVERALAELPEELEARLVASAEERLTVSDRILATFSGLGAAAAVVVGVFTYQLLAAPALTAPPAAADMAQHQRMIREYQTLLAAK